MVNAWRRRCRMTGAPVAKCVRPGHPVRSGEVSLPVGVDIPGAVRRTKLGPPLPVPGLGPQHRDAWRSAVQLPWTVLMVVCGGRFVVHGTLHYARHVTSPRSR